MNQQSRFNIGDIIQKKTNYGNCCGIVLYNNLNNFHVLWFDVEHFYNWNSKEILYKEIYKRSSDNYFKLIASIN